MLVSSISPTVYHFLRDKKQLDGALEAMTKIEEKTKETNDSEEESEEEDTPKKKKAREDKKNKKRLQRIKIDGITMLCPGRKKGELDDQEQTWTGLYSMAVGMLVDLDEEYEEDLRTSFFAKGEGSLKNGIVVKPVIGTGGKGVFRLVHRGKMDEDGTEIVTVLPLLGWQEEDGWRCDSGGNVGAEATEGWRSAGAYFPSEPEPVGEYRFEPYVTECHEEECRFMAAVNKDRKMGFKKKTCYMVKGNFTEGKLTVSEAGTPLDVRSLGKKVLDGMEFNGPPVCGYLIYRVDLFYSNEVTGYKQWFVNEIGIFPCCKSYLRSTVKDAEHIELLAENMSQYIKASYLAGRAKKAN